MLWIRMGLRYRTATNGNVSSPIIDRENKCSTLPEAVQIEMGILRCSASLNDRAKWDDYEREAQVSLDDSWRLKLAQCQAAGALRARHHEVGNDVIRAFGPDGGVVGWVTHAYIKQSPRQE